MPRIVFDRTFFFSETSIVKVVFCQKKMPYYMEEDRERVVNDPPSEGFSFLDTGSVVS